MLCVHVLIIDARHFACMLCYVGINDTAVHARLALPHQHIAEECHRTAVQACALKMALIPHVRRSTLQRTISLRCRIVFTYEAVLCCAPVWCACAAICCACAVPYCAVPACLVHSAHMQNNVDVGLHVLYRCSLFMLCNLMSIGFAHRCSRSGI